MTSPRAAVGSSAVDGAVVLAGGRASRLGGVVKPLLVQDGATLLAQAVSAVPGAAVVVVGPAELVVPDGVALVREEPWFGGPVAALRTGCARLPSTAERVWVLAADQPAVHRSVALLAAAQPGADGVIGVDAGGRRQPLTACYARSALDRALAAAARAGTDRVVELVAGLDLREVPLGDRLDVDTAEDAAAFGIALPDGGGAGFSGPAGRPDRR